MNIRELVDSRVPVVPTEGRLRTKMNWRKRQLADLRLDDYEKRVAMLGNVGKKGFAVWLAAYRAGTDEGRHPLDLFRPLRKAPNEDGRARQARLIRTHGQCIMETMKGERCKNPVSPREIGVCGGHAYHIARRRG